MDDELDELDMCGSCGHYSNGDCERRGGEAGYEDEGCDYHTDYGEED